MNLYTSLSQWWDKYWWLSLLILVWCSGFLWIVRDIFRRNNRQREEWQKRSRFTRVRLEFADGNACELTGDAAQQWHEDMFFGRQSGIADTYSWKAAAPLGTVATPTHPAVEIEEWACGKRQSVGFELLWISFERLFYQHERFEPNRRDSRVQEAMSWFYRGLLWRQLDDAILSERPASSEATQPEPPSPAGA